MTIDEAIKFCNEKTKNIKLKTEPQTFIDIAEWLKELKTYQNQHNAMCEQHKVKTIEDIYNKAIDDFFDELQRYEDDDWLKLKMSSIYQIAEQLKERECRQWLKQWE